MELDVVIIGAGISGINAAYRIQNALPSSRFLILDARNDIGGTWSFFAYPGLRSDSDLYTFGFPWKPWRGGKPIATAPMIMEYLREAVAETGIDQQIRLQHHVSTANWSTEARKWQLLVTNADGKSLSLTAKFLVMGTGYYDYDEGLPVSIPGLNKFEGPIVHPQFWPEDLDYCGRKVVIVGSGATAITLLPNLSVKAAHVTMLQRSPTYIMNIPNSEESLLNRLLPESFAIQLNRIFFIVWPIFIYYFCRTFPTWARRIIRRGVARELPDHVPMDPHFTPRYKPWDQRLCFTPDGDFFEAIREGKASIVTGSICDVVEDGIILESGEKVAADVVVTATGLKLRAMGGIQILVDDQKINVGEKYAWNNSMIEDIPNLFFVLGYINASWTLGADTTAQLLCRLMKHMQERNIRSAVPVVKNPKDIGFSPLLQLKSTYVSQGASELPKCGVKGPWVPRKNYLSDLFGVIFGDILEELVFSDAQRPKETVGVLKE